MFGSEYYRHPEILIDSLKDMEEKYKKIPKNKKEGLLGFLEKIYVRIFGIPEIGFQVRSMYFRQMLWQNVKQANIGNVLDAGSGTGVYSIMLGKRYPKSQIFGWEIDDTKLKFSKAFVKELGLKNVQFELRDITKNIYKKNRFDLIVNIDVLEHIDDYKEVLKNFYKLMNKNGYLFIHTPQVNQKRIFGKLKDWHHAEHIHEGYSPQELRSELNNIGFKVLDMRETFGLFGKIAWELNHMLIPKGFVLVGIVYPLLYCVSSLDLLTKNDKGLGIAVLAKKL